MNKTISEANKARLQRCIVDMNNKVHCYETTGIALTTIDRILERGYAKEGQLDKLFAYCDEVDGLTVANHKD